MIKNYLALLLLFPALLWSQGITVSTTAFTPEQLVTNVLMTTDCAAISNISASAACGMGYFNANGSGFPFAKGVILRTGLAASTAGIFTGASTSSVCSNQTDADLQQIVFANGGTGIVRDASFIKFDFVAQKNLLSFNYVFASQDYGPLQCSNTFHDAIAIILTDLDTGISTNLAVVPNTNSPVSVNTIRDALYGPQCSSVNPQYFGNYNFGNPQDSHLNLAGNTVPLVATSSLVVGNSYSLKFVVGDIGDMALDSAILIEGALGSYACGDGIEMMAFIDTNNNGLKDTDEIPFKHGTFSHQVNNTGDVVLSSNPNGTVYIGTSSSTDTYDLNYTIDAAFDAYFNSSASFNDITVAADSGVNTYYFPIANTQAYNDVAVSLVSSNQPQPGFIYHQTIVVTNNGISPSSGTVTFIKDPLLNITAIWPSGTVTTDTGFTYAYTDLLPNENLVLVVAALMPWIPTVALGDYITNSVSVTTTTAETNTENNTNTVAEMIVGAYDPNDKMESRGIKIPFESFDGNDHLEYTIRFQNTGNYYATTVKIEDELEAQLDPATFQMVGASHDYTLTRTNNKLVWTFHDIILPSMEDSEEASQGYVRFKIKPAPGFAIGDIITNKAEIFFDFNPPIVTNLFATEFTTTLSNPDFNSGMLVVYPNPAKTTVTVSSNNDNIATLKIMDLAGKVIRTLDVNAKTASVRVSDLSSGIYLLELSNSKRERVVKKLVIN